MTEGDGVRLSNIVRNSDARGPSSHKQQRESFASFVIGKQNVCGALIEDVQMGAYERDINDLILRKEIIVNLYILGWVQLSIFCSTTECSL